MNDMRYFYLDHFDDDPR